jgi:hypothetical protein
MLYAQARQDSNLQPLVWERTPSKAGVGTVPDTEQQPGSRYRIPSAWEASDHCRYSPPLGRGSSDLRSASGSTGFEQYLREISVLEGEPVVLLSEAEVKAIRVRNHSHVMYEQP